MTCLEKFKTEHSDNTPVALIGKCPHDYGYLEKPKNCSEISCYKECWTRKIPEEKIKED